MIEILACFVVVVGLICSTIAYVNLLEHRRYMATDRNLLDYKLNLARQEAVERIMYLEGHS